jgi:hypothetical protein
MRGGWTIRSGRRRIPIMTWDYACDLKSLLDNYSEATGHSYVLLVAQGTEETPRVIVQTSAALPDTCGPGVLFALEDAAAELFEDMAAHFGIDDGPAA